MAGSINNNNDNAQDDMSSCDDWTMIKWWFNNGNSNDITKMATLTMTMPMGQHSSNSGDNDEDAKLAVKVEMTQQQQQQCHNDNATVTVGTTWQQQQGQWWLNLLLFLLLLFSPLTEMPLLLPSNLHCCPKVDCCRKLFDWWLWPLLSPHRHQCCWHHFAVLPGNGMSCFLERQAPRSEMTTPRIVAMELKLLRKNFQ